MRKGNLGDTQGSLDFEMGGVFSSTKPLPNANEARLGQMQFLVPCQEPEQEMELIVTAEELQAAAP